MANCPICGAAINEGVKFCSKCGANLTNSVAANTEATKQPVEQQVYTQPVKKSKTPLIIGIVVAVVAIVVILLILLLFSGNGISGDEEKFVGTWEYSTELGGIGDYSAVYVFNSDKSWELGVSGQTPIKIGSWKVENNKLVLSASDTINEYQAGTYTYKFSNNYQSLTLGMNNIDLMTFTKTGPANDETQADDDVDNDSESEDTDDGSETDDGNNDVGGDASLYGTWEYSISEYAIIYIFNSDGSLEIGASGFTSEVGTWSTSGNQLCLYYSSSESGEDMCYTYSIIGDELGLSYEGYQVMTLTKQ